MQCPACGFENMPGQSRCGRCNAQLLSNADEPSVQLSPPRAGTLKFLRPLRYAANRTVDALPQKMPARVARAFVGGIFLPREAIAAMFLSIIPGLGHLFDGRRRDAAICFGVWLLLLFLTLNFYAGNTGGILGGLLVSWHASVAFNAGRPQRFIRERGQMLRLIFPMLFVCFFVYFSVNRVIRNRYNLVACTFDIPQHQVTQGNVLLCRIDRSRWKQHLQRGSLWVVQRSRNRHMTQIRDHVYIGFDQEGEALFWLLGLPGDKIDVSPEGLSVNAEPVDLGPVLRERLLMPEDPLSLEVPENTVFAITNIQVQAPEQYFGLVWQNVFMVQQRRLYARAIAVYLPITNRRRLHSGSRS